MYLWILTLNFGDDETMARISRLIYNVTFSVSVFKVLFMISTIPIFYAPIKDATDAITS